MSVYQINAAAASVVPGSQSTTPDPWSTRTNSPAIEPASPEHQSTDSCTMWSPAPAPYRVTRTALPSTTLLAGVQRRILLGAQAMPEPKSR
jgi:hypothetical protein